MKTVIELHDKYLQVCSLISHSLSLCSSSSHFQEPLQPASTLLTGNRLICAM